MHLRAYAQCKHSLALIISDVELVTKPLLPNLLFGSKTFDGWTNARQRLHEDRKIAIRVPEDEEAASVLQ